MANHHATIFYICVCLNPLRRSSTAQGASIYIFADLLHILLYKRNSATSPSCCSSHRNIILLHCGFIYPHVDNILLVLPLTRSLKSASSLMGSFLLLRKPMERAPRAGKGAYTCWGGNFGGLGGGTLGLGGESSSDLGRSFSGSSKNFSILPSPWGPLPPGCPLAAMWICFFYKLRYWFAAAASLMLRLMGVIAKVDLLSTRFMIKRPTESRGRTTGFLYSRGRRQ
jgi:hypothetical protein